MVVISSPVVHQGEGQARIHAAAVHVHRACAALAVVAALFGAGECDGLAEAVEQRRPRVDAELVVLAVDAQRDRDRTRDVGPVRTRGGHGPARGLFAVPAHADRRRPPRYHPWSEEMPRGSNLTGSMGDRQAWSLRSGWGNSVSMKDETEPPRPAPGHPISTTTGKPPDARRCNTRTAKAATAGQPGDVTLFLSLHEDGVATRTRARRGNRGGRSPGDAAMHGVLARKSDLARYLDFMPALSGPGKVRCQDTGKQFDCPRSGGVALDTRPRTRSSRRTGRRRYPPSARRRNYRKRAYRSAHPARDTPRANVTNRSSGSRASG